MIYFTKETESCKTIVQLLQNIHGVDITHDNVYSSMLSCFFSYVAATLNRVSYFLFKGWSNYSKVKRSNQGHILILHTYIPPTNVSIKYHFLYLMVFEIQAGQDCSSNLRNCPAKCHNWKPYLHSRKGYGIKMIYAVSE